MGSANARRNDDVQTQIKSAFTELNRTSAPSQGRKYPKELQDLVRQAFAEGIELATLEKLTGVSPTTLTRWCKAIKLPTAQREVKVRRLEVVHGNADKHERGVVVRLPSGVSIEFSDAAALNHDFLISLAGLGGYLATSR